MEKYVVLLGVCLVANLALARNLSGEHNEENVAEELADVEIMIAQMRLIFGGSVGYDVDRIKAQKLARLRKRMEEEE